MCRQSHAASTTLSRLSHATQARGSATRHITRTVIGGVELPLWRPKERKLSEPVEGGWYSVWSDFFQSIAFKVTGRRLWGSGEVFDMCDSSGIVVISKSGMWCSVWYCGNGGKGNTLSVVAMDLVGTWSLRYVLFWKYTPGHLICKTRRCIKQTSFY